MIPEFDHEPGAGRREYLARAHRDAQKAQINAPDDHGAFPGTWLDLLFDDPVIIVPDTNVLRQDIDAACGRNGRGVLITAANSGAFRLICAEHVVDEVERQLEEWARDKGRSVDAYADQWNAEYLPLLHVVRGAGLPLSVLSPAERFRLDRLPEPKEDIASIVLALALGAFYLTKDARAWEAVYARSADTDELYRWLEALKEGGDASQLGRLAQVSVSVTVLGIAGVGHLMKRLWPVAPWAVAALGGLGALAAVRTPVERYQRIGAALVRGFGALSEEIYIPYYELKQRFQKRAPEIPTWEALEKTNDRDSVLVRACMYYLGRAKVPQMTAKQLAKRLLYHLTIGREEKRVREILRSHTDCFHSPYKGQWQVGHALTV
jgi:hypothetical protein